MKLTARFFALQASLLFLFPGCNNPTTEAPENEKLDWYEGEPGTRVSGPPKAPQEPFEGNTTPFASEYSLDPIPFDSPRDPSEGEWIPDPLREFRAAWVSTDQNRDWPSRPGLPVQAMKQEATAILDRLVKLNLNAVVFQVRPQADAFYQSDLEPWSYYLTGVQGRPPASGFDPLAFWIEEAHSRGLQLHAWFSPYRAYRGSSQGPMSDFIVNSDTESVIKLADNGRWWLNPASEVAREHTVKVILDVVSRYNIDGVHLDNEFYPHQAGSGELDFPDSTSYLAYRESGGELDRAEWRQEAVSFLVEELYHGIKSAERHVEFGISPIGQWRDSQRTTRASLESYRELNASAADWFIEGWVDYLIPSLTMANARAMDYSSLLDWWHEQNFQDRHLWPGLRIGEPDEMGRQVEATRTSVGIRSGTCLFGVSELLSGQVKTSSMLTGGLWSEKALIPETPWLGIDRPVPPKLSKVTVTGGGQIAKMTAMNDDVFQVVINEKREGKWSRPDILSVYRGHEIDREVEAVAVRVVNRVRLMSDPVILKLDNPEGPAKPVKRSIQRTESVDKFSFNTDGSGSGKLSGSHQARTASGIGNGGEILGYTIPLDSSLRRIKTKNGRPVARLKQAAILTFTSGDQTVRLLAVGNDTGGRHIDGNSRNRGWGELGINTWREVKRQGIKVQIARNRLGIPRGTRLEYGFLDQTVSSIKEYRELKATLTEQGMLGPAQSSNLKFEFADSGNGEP